MGKTIKIGILSDTHIPTRARKLPDLEIFRDSDYIIHAGDYVTPAVIDELKKIAPFVGCHGNMDKYPLKNELPKIATLKIENLVIKIIHDLGGGSKIKELKKEKVNVIVHGHTHKKSVEKTDILIINPGSATSSFYDTNSVGILYITSDNIDYEFVDLK